MLQAFLRQDRSYDSLFFTGVKTTGIFCRPSCSARKPLPENIEFFFSIREASFAGYRPCKRCDPLHIHGERPEWVTEVLQEIDQHPDVRIKDGDLRKFGVEPSKVRRYFLKHYGMTFQAFCRSRRLGKAFELIRQGTDLTEVGYDHGYESTSGFREAFIQLFGKPPGKSRGADQVVISWMESPLGPLVAGATDKGICLLEFTDRRMLEAQFKALRALFKTGLSPGEHKHLRQLRKELGEYFAGKRKTFTLPLDFPGSPFQQKVWNELLHIPYGVTRSYEDIARCIGSPRAVRALGHANGLNRIAILIPCHRVVNKSGKLGGYGGGIWRKKRLLDLEQSNPKQEALFPFRAEVQTLSG